MSDTTKRALLRVLRYVFLPAVIAVVDALVTVIGRGSFVVDWNAVAVIGVTAILAGLSKWLRDELAIDVKIV